jgi:hypothetical protein
MTQRALHLPTCLPRIRISQILCFFPFSTSLTAGQGWRIASSEHNIYRNLMMTCAWPSNKHFFLLGDQSWRKPKLWTLVNFPLWGSSIFFKLLLEIEEGRIRRFVFPVRCAQLFFRPRRKASHRASSKAVGNASTFWLTDRLAGIAESIQRNFYKHHPKRTHPSTRLRWAGLRDTIIYRHMRGELRIAFPIVFRERRERASMKYKQESHCKCCRPSHYFGWDLECWHPYRAAEGSRKTIYLENNTMTQPIRTVTLQKFETPCWLVLSPPSNSGLVATWDGIDWPIYSISGS